MLGRFERAIPLVAGSLVIGMVTLAVFSPPELRTSRPSAVLANHASQFFLEPGQALPDGLIRVNTPGNVTEGIVEGIILQPTGQHSANALDEAFDRLGYNLDAISNEGAFVPRIFLASLPKDLNKVRRTEKRKAIFFRSVLPLVLQANEEIIFDRKRLLRLHTQIQKGQKLDAVDRLWLIVLSERYKVQRGEIEALIARVDIVPPSLALAQAAEESGWGTSRFSRVGNAIFGEWTFSTSDSVIPRQRDKGKRHRIKVFKSLLHSVRAYVRNLNSHRAYREFRIKRHTQRRQGTVIRGGALVDTLTRYSERGEKYVKSLRDIMVGNKLERLDEARLGQGAQASRAASKI